MWLIFPIRGLRNEDGIGSGSGWQRTESFITYYKSLFDFLVCWQFSNVRYTISTKQTLKNICCNKPSAYLTMLLNDNSRDHWEPRGMTDIDSKVTIPPYQIKSLYGLAFFSVLECFFSCRQVYFSMLKVGRNSLVDAGWDNLLLHSQSCSCDKTAKMLFVFRTFRHL